MFDSHDVRQGKSYAHVVRLYVKLKLHDKCAVCSMDIKRYVKLFKKVTGEELHFKELKRDTYSVSLNEFKNYLNDTKIKSKRFV